MTCWWKKWINLRTCISFGKWGQDWGSIPDSWKNRNIVRIFYKILDMVLALILLLFLVNTKYGNENKGNLNKMEQKHLLSFRLCLRYTSKRLSSLVAHHSTLRQKNLTISTNRTFGIWTKNYSQSDRFKIARAHEKNWTIFLKRTLRIRICYWSF